MISRGWGGLEFSSDNPDVLVVDQVPHELLLPRVRAAVHHGGAATVAGAVRAGIPQVVCPYVADQPFWAHRMQALGVGPRPTAATRSHRRCPDRPARHRTHRAFLRRARRGAGCSSTGRRRPSPGGETDRASRALTVHGFARAVVCDVGWRAQMRWAGWLRNHLECTCWTGCAAPWQSEASVNPCCAFLVRAGPESA